MAVASRRLLVLALALIALLATSVLSGGPAVARDVLQTEFSLTVVSTRDSFLTQGRSRTLTEANGSMMVGAQRRPDGLTVVNVMANDDTALGAVDLSIAGHHDWALRPGPHPVVAGYAQHLAGADLPAEHLTMTMGMGHRGCNSTVGSADVRDAVVDRNNRVVALWLLYDLRCEGGMPSVTGELRYGYPDDAVEVAPAAQRFSRMVDPGDRTGELLAHLRGRSGTVSSVALAGPDAGQFAVGDHTCTGVALAPARPCVVPVRYRPSTAGPHQAELVVTTSAGTRRVQLDGRGHPGTSRFTNVASPGDYIGGGVARDLDATEAYFGSVLSNGGREIGVAVIPPGGGRIDLGLLAPPGEVLQAGRTYTFDERVAPEPMLRASVGDRGCNQRWGTFTITALRDGPIDPVDAPVPEVLGSGWDQLDQLDVSFTQVCDISTSVFTGRIQVGTRSDLTPPAAPTGLTLSADRSSLSWSRPADAARVVVRVHESVPALTSPTAGHPVASTTGTTAPVPSPWRTGRVTLVAYAVDAAGNVSAPARLITPLPAAQPRVLRVSGPNRYETSAAVSRHAFDPGVEVAFVASGAAFPDALAASAVGGSYPAPVLLTTRDAVPTAVLAELRRLEVGRLVVLGGTGAVSQAAEDQLQTVGAGVIERWEGANRYETAGLVARNTYPFEAHGQIVVASGTAFPDAVAAAPAAAYLDAPLLLTAQDRLPHDTGTALTLLGLQRNEVTVIGGEGSVSSGVYEVLRNYSYDGHIRRLAGANRYATSTAISAATFDPGVEVAYVVNGLTFPDALSAGSAAGKTPGPVLLTRPDALPAVVAAELDRLDPHQVVVVGGTSAVNDAVLVQLGSYVVP